MGDFLSDNSSMILNFKTNTNSTPRYIPKDLKTSGTTRSGLSEKFISNSELKKYSKQKFDFKKMLNKPNKAKKLK